MSFYYAGTQSNKAEALEELKQNRVIAVDTETISLKDTTVIGIGVSTGEHSYYFPVLPDPDENIELVLDLVSSPDVVKIYHNALYDLHSLGQLCIELGHRLPDYIHIHDTMLMAKVLGLEAGLDALSQDLLKISNKYNIKDLLAEVGSRATMLDVDQRQTSEKCITDAYCTYKLHQVLSARLNAQQLDCYQVDIKLIPILKSMENRGLALDEKVLESEKFRLSKEIEKYESASSSLGFDVGSNREVGLYLASRGFNLPLTNSGRDLRVDEETLSSIQDPISQLVLKFRKARKLLSTYIEPYMEEDRAYTRFRMDLSTGRLASFNRNLQNIPPDTRKIFSPDSELFTWMDFCVAPETKILKADLTWSNAKDIKVGEELITIEEYPSLKRRRVCVSGLVQKVTELTQPCYKLILSDGREVICSNEHRWLRARLNGAYRGVTKTDWVKTKDLIVGDYLRSFCQKTWETEDTYEAGWLAGFFDGEGYLESGNSKTVGFGQNSGPILEYAIKLLEERGFNIKRNQYREKLVQARFTNRAEGIRFLGQIRPKRLLPKSDTLWLYSEPPQGPREERQGVVSISSIEYLGEQEVIGIQTSTGTYIANGLISHNSQIEMRVFAYTSGDSVLQEAYRNGEDIHAKTQLALWPGSNTKDPAKRLVAKTFNFAMIFNASTKVLAVQTKLPLATCGAFRKIWLNTYSGGHEFMDMCMSEMTDSVESAFGRKMRLPLDMPDFHIDKCKINYRIQGTAADIIKRAMITMADVDLRLQVHDELLVNGEYEFSQGLSNIHSEIFTPFETKAGPKWS